MHVIENCLYCIFVIWSYVFSCIYVMYLYKYGYNCMRIANCFYLNVVLVVFCNYYIYNVKHNDENNVFAS